VLTRAAPRKLIVYSRDEAEAERNAGRPERAVWPQKMAALRFFLGDVRDVSG